VTRTDQGVAEERLLLAQLGGVGAAGQVDPDIDEDIVHQPPLADDRQAQGLQVDVLTDVALSFLFGFGRLRRGGGQRQDGGDEGSANHAEQHRRNRLPQG